MESCLQDRSASCFVLLSDLAKAFDQIKPVLDLLCPTARISVCHICPVWSTRATSHTWLASCFRHSPIQPLARPRQLQALAATNACAEDEMVGIGGWAITSSQVVWFAETWNARHTSRVKPAQRYSACFETLAQLALLQATHSHIGGGHYSFSMPSGTDNSATEASLNKLFTTSWPLQLLCN